MNNIIWELISLPKDYQQLVTNRYTKQERMLMERWIDTRHDLWQKDIKWHDINYEKVYAHVVKWRYYVY